MLKNLISRHASVTHKFVRHRRTWTKSERVYKKIEKHAEEKRQKDRAKKEGTANFGGAVLRNPKFEIDQKKYTLVSHMRPESKGPAPAPDSNFAVVELAGTQFKVAPGDVVICNKIKDVRVGQEFEINDVLLVGGSNATVIGQPHVPEGKVTAVMEQQTLEKKVTVFKMRRRQGYRRKNGHRREISVLRIKDVTTGPLYEKALAL